MNFIHQLARFTWIQILCCVFPAIIFVSLAFSKFITPQGLYRYDFILGICLLTQYALIKSGLETWEEFKVIMWFHLLGLCLELYKVHMGSWGYPEQAFTKIAGVPLYSGFMYASVASYIVQAWRRFNLSIKAWPSAWVAWVLAIGIYANFFTHHYWLDLRWYLTALLLWVFRKTWVNFRVGHSEYQMPMTLSYMLIGFFIWVAENISTCLGAWQYPNQEHGWHLVHLGKISSWFLLVIISVIIVANLKFKQVNETVSQ